ncbi:MAG: peroxiredoxin [Candidatus Latescibacteria bacterium]|nr:peroxiredoxin [Candidatus Latescibacterota bacterium]
MRHFKIAIASVLVFAALVATVPAAQEDSPEPALPDLQVGDAAPAFQAKDDGGQTWKSTDHVGKKIVVVFFYPAAMTGGCTKQACNFRDVKPELNDLGAEVIGVSGDTSEGQALFKRAHGLDYTLLADADGAVAKAFGVPLKKGGSIQRTVDEKEVTLTRGVTAKRWTFVIDKAGKIAFKNTSVQAATDGDAILDVVKGLAGS